MPEHHLNPDGTVNLDAEPSHHDPHAIVECPLCDDEGYRGSAVCDHVDRTQTAARGHDLVEAELAKIRQRKANAARGVSA